MDDIETQLQKESEHLFTLWCSGRQCCEGMLVELKLLKRQVNDFFLKYCNENSQIEWNYKYLTET